jgi:hypothetical protein
MYGGGISFESSSNNVNYDRFYNNNATNGTDVYMDDVNNISCNWWADNNNPTKATNGKVQIAAPDGCMDNYYQVQLYANDYTTFNNTTYNGFVPINVGYRLVLNGTNDNSSVLNLPGFNAIITSALLNSSVTQFRLLGDSNDHDARYNWINSITTAGNNMLRALVDNEDISINIKATNDDKLPPTKNSTDKPNESLDNTDRFNNRSNNIGLNAAGSNTTGLNNTGLNTSGSNNTGFNNGLLDTVSPLIILLSFLSILIVVGGVLYLRRK